VTALTHLTLAEARDGLARKRFSAAELAEAHIGAIEQARALNAFVRETPERALAMAKVSDARIARGEARPLEGIPLGIKDLFATHGVVSTAGSNILKNFAPPYESTVTHNLWSDGAVMLGKLNLDEFAMGSSNETSAFGPVVSPWRRKGSNVGADASGAIEGAHLVPGGSSGGSAAAVAARLCVGATATDTGGSIRQPAAFTGTVGIKPTYGGVSRYGAIALASSLDQVGPVARTVLDAGLLHDVIGGHDPHDSTSLTDTWPSFAEAAREGARGDVLKGLRIGVIAELPDSGFQPGVAASFHEALAAMQAQGAEIVEISAPHFEYGVAAYYLILPAEASSNLAKFDSVRFGMRVTPHAQATVEEVMAATRDAGFGDEVKRRIILGTYALSAGYYDAYYGSAQKVRTLIQRDFDLAFEQVDVIATPSAPTTAFRLGERVDDPLQMYLNDVTTIPANLAGVPGISVPSGLAAEDGLPVGIQFLAPVREDARLYRVGAALEALLHESWGGSLLDRAPQLTQGGVA
jgi:aspartyl-tRNA(Asn)/glutamyl-tRNA(Gln) amidotransferase subunit A